MTTCSCTGNEREMFSLQKNTHTRTFVEEYMERSGDGKTADADETLSMSPRRFSAILGSKSKVMPVTERMLQCINWVQKAGASGR